MHLPDPVFPPLLNGHAVRSPRRAFDAAVAGARQGELGAGDVVWGRTTRQLDCAVVLEPDVPPARAAEMIFIMLVAFGDSFGSLSPPEVALSFGWPTIIRLNGGRVGEVHAAMSAECDDLGSPRWMVVGLEVDLQAPSGRAAEPGHTPEVTTLADEGCGEITRTELLESVSRHLLTWIHNWEVDGFQEVHASLLYRLEGYREDISVEIGGTTRRGRFTGLDEHGNMLLETGEGSKLLEALWAIDMIDTAEAAS